MRALVSVWDTLSPAEREAKLKEIINKQLGKSGTPEVGINKKDFASPNTNGELDFENWNLDISKRLLDGAGPLSAQQAKGLANTVLHEARHGEQWFAAAQRLAARGKSAAAIAGRTGMPLSVAEAAKNIPLKAGSSPMGVLGEATRRSVYGKGAAHRYDVLVNELPGATRNTDPGYQRYRALAEEQDAWATGDLTNDACL